MRVNHWLCLLSHVGQAIEEREKRSRNSYHEIDLLFFPPDLPGVKLLGFKGISYLYSRR